ncbi:cell envelope biogenesis protein OmpA [Piscirickettsia litoralis]|uniref:Cell envelope biogenesis protein OmpA n=1 Tax=Piscirickettsia litoralis TaxID=1891921 RepID=A0ABX2ZZL8_9GAMM|nr:cell envelope biogenesis protein OmpA [Piscirickettsia litoralis]ODN42034.1 cell envelope biogenesis protein OmpA [Piscirickettsia litoralis]
MLVGCASTPQLYPNAKYKRVGKVVAQKDIDLCTQEANEYLKSSKAKQVLKGAGSGAAVGAAGGAAVGVVGGLISGGWGSLLGSTAVGAGVGAAAGGTAAGISPDQLKQRYISKCLTDKGYEVLGWS